MKIKKTVPGIGDLWYAATRKGIDLCFRKYKFYSRVEWGCGQKLGPGFAPSRSVMAPSQVFAYNQEDLILQATS